MNQIKKTVLLLLFGLLATFSSQAANIINLNVDFSRSDWQYFAAPLWGGKFETVETPEGTAVRIPNGNFFQTAVLPYYAGKIIVEFDAKTSDITPNGEGWKVAAVQISYYRGDNAFAHDDALLEGKAKDYQHFRSILAPAKSTSGFTVSFGNYGQDGYLEIRNLKIYVELPGKNLQPDASFEGMYGLDNWLMKRDGGDWDNSPVANEGNTNEAVTGVFPGPGATAHLANGATLISRRYKYNGEDFVWGAWLKLDNVERGFLPWAGAGLQLVEFDENGKVVGHNDLLLETGTKDWKYYQFVSGKLSPRTRSVEMWARVFDGAKGDLYLDEVSLVYLNDGVARAPRDLEKATIEVGLPENQNPINPVWNGVDLSYVSYMGHPVLKETLRNLRDGGIEWVRSREFLQGPRVLKAINPDGTFVCDFTQLDEWMDYAVLELGLNLVPTMETTPYLMTTNPDASPNGDADGYPPRDPDEWGRFIKEVVRHWIERYGTERVSKWVFECWNEPEAAGFYKGSEAYFGKMFKAYVQALAELEDEYNIDLNIATPSGASVTGTYFSTCFAEAENAGLANRMNSASMHCYGGFAGAVSNYSDTIETIRKTMSEFPGLPENMETHMTEFNGTAMVSGYFDTQVDAALLIRIMMVMLDNNLTRSYFYCAGDHPYIKYDQHFNGDLGIFTSSGMPKPVFNSYLLLNELKDGVRLPVKSSNEPFHALAAQCADGRMRVIVSGFDEEDLDGINTANVTLKIALPENYTITTPVTRRTIDSVKANCHTAFVADGLPLVAEHPDTASWIEAGKMVAEEVENYTVENGVLTLTFPMERNSVAAFEF